MIRLATFSGKLVGWLSRQLNRGSGTAWSGKIALSFYPSLIKKLSQNLDERIVVIGTNGKTTTAAMIAHILENCDVEIVHNTTGANLKNGLAGSLISKTTSSGALKARIGVFEVDEAEFGNVFDELQPTLIVMLNLFRDQLDRYGEIDVIAKKWRKILKTASNKPSLLVNSDDPLVASIGISYEGKAAYFGYEGAVRRKKTESTADSVYCLNCGEKLAYSSVTYSHFGKWDCVACSYTRPKPNIEKVTNPLSGMYNYYNALAALETAILVGLDKQRAQAALSTFAPAFGRQEKFTYKGRTVQMILSKNPTGFNESMRTVLELAKKPTVIIALNDRFLDGVDVSWIWDTHLEDLLVANARIICTGDRAYDIGLRAIYASPDQDVEKNVLTTPKLIDALSMGIECTKSEETIYILPTYSAMLDLRKILTGKKI